MLLRDKIKLQCICLCVTAVSTQSPNKWEYAVRMMSVSLSEAANNKVWLGWETQCRPLLGPGDGGRGNVTHLTLSSSSPKGPSEGHAGQPQSSLVNQHYPHGCDSSNYKDPNMLKLTIDPHIIWHVVIIKVHFEKLFVINILVNHPVATSMCCYQHNINSIRDLELLFSLHMKQTIWISLVCLLVFFNKTD